MTEPGISFIIRARNEAHALFDNLLSLRTLTVPHEIIVTLHRCTDESQEVVETWQRHGLPVRYVLDDTRTSRAGYETLVTPVDHPNSFSAFSARCFSHAKYNWLVRWDADFVATAPFIEFLNTVVNLAETEPLAYQLSCALGDTVVCREEYMFNTYRGFGKYYLWEHCLQDDTRKSIVINDVCMTSFPPAVVKPYWSETPWFLDAATYDEELADKYRRLLSVVGPEPPGFARSNNPDFAPHWARLMASMPILERYGIYHDR
jgi:hypothetical protein